MGQTATTGSCVAARAAPCTGLRTTTPHVSRATFRPALSEARVAVMRGQARRDISNRHNITPGPGAHGGLYTQFGCATECNTLLSFSLQNMRNFKNYQ